MFNKKEIEKEIMYLKEVTEDTKKRITKLRKLVPGEFYLRAVRHAGSTQYFMRKNSGDLNGTYIKKKDRRIAEALAQIEYDKKLLQILSDEMAELENLCNVPTEDPFASALEQMSDLKRSLIKLPFISREAYILNWLKQDYEKPEFRDDAPEFYTRKGLRVRSKSEILIAETLDEFEIPYLYEKPIVFSNGITVHPDFTILKSGSNMEICWEHFGMMDDIEYRNNAFMKVRQYEQNGYFQGVNFIWTFETSKYPINSRSIRNMISAFNN